MRITRDRSRTIFRQRNRWGGCFSWLLTIGLIATGLLFAREPLQTWITERLYPPAELATVDDVQVAFNNGDLDRAVTYAEEIYASRPGDQAALEQLIRSLIYRSYADINREADRTRALELTRRAVEQTPYDLRVLGSHALALQANEASEDAQRVALRVIRNDEQSITARLALALSYASQGIFQAGLRDSVRAVEIANRYHPDWRADAYRVQAIAHSDLGQYTEAADAVETAIGYNRRLIPLHFERALYAQQLGDMDTATAYYFNVIAFDEGNAKARLRLCDVSSLLGERDAAIDWCTQVTALAPGWAEGWYWLGREYYLNGDWRETQISLNRCSTLEVAQDVPPQERRFECWYLQGQAAEVLGDCPSLLQLYGEYRAMAQAANLSQSWIYPDDVPPICVTPTPEGNR